MALDDPTGTVIRQQRRWAGSRGIALDDRARTLQLDDNLFQPLNLETRKEFEAGAGNELAGDLRSIRSSAALACNVFDFWRGRDARPIARACNVGDGDVAVSFEQKFPTGLGGMPPHLDVVLEPQGAAPTAIESKFTEIYTQHEDAFRPSYFARVELWSELPRTLSLAEAIADGSLPYERLGAAQLVKHALGLTRAYGASGFRLLYLWFEVPGEPARVHRAEIDSFADRVGEDFAFDAMAYADVAERLRADLSVDRAYIDYLDSRYFG